MRKLLGLLSFLVISTSCGLLQKEEEAPQPRNTVVIGEVTSVHSKQGFVLFRRYGPGDLLTGGVMSSRSVDGRRAADLQLSPEKMGRFYTADFSKEGIEPRVGDLVVLSKVADDTQSSNLVTEKTETEELEVKKIGFSPLPEIPDSTTSQGSR